jgi:hypothetical protein
MGDKLDVEHHTISVSKQDAQDAGFTLRSYTPTRQKQDEATQNVGNLMAQVR